MASRRKGGNRHRSQHRNRDMLGGYKKRAIEDDANRSPNCPDHLLLFFHHAPYTRLRSGIVARTSRCGQAMKSALKASPMKEDPRPGFSGGSGLIRMKTVTTICGHAIAPAAVDPGTAPRPGVVPLFGRPLEHLSVECGVRIVYDQAEINRG
jgi:hypothetical protein